MDSNIQSILSSPLVTEFSDIVTAANAAQEVIDSLAAANGQLSSANASLTQQVSDLTSVKVFDALEWIQATVAGGSVANTAGNTGVAADAQSVPTNLCAYRDIFPNGQYQDKYWFWQLGADSSKSHYTYEIRMMLPTAADCAASQALELDIEHRITGMIYNTGLQFDFASKTVRIWNRSASTATVPHGWISTTLPNQRWATGAWTQIKLETHRDAANVYYDAVTLNGITTDLSAFSFPALASTKPDCLNCAVQLDGNSTGTSYRVHIDGVRFTTK